MDSLTFEFESNLAAFAPPGGGDGRGGAAAFGGAPNPYAGRERRTRATKDVVCRYWIKGRCMNEETCTFLHQVCVAVCGVCVRVRRRGRGRVREGGRRLLACSASKCLRVPRSPSALPRPSWACMVMYSCSAPPLPLPGAGCMLFCGHVFLGPSGAGRVACGGTISLFWYSAHMLAVYTCMCAHVRSGPLLPPAAAIGCVKSAGRRCLGVFVEYLLSFVCVCVCGVVLFCSSTPSRCPSAASARVAI